jgi:pre-rRNA-processing protein TSR2
VIGEKSSTSPSCQDRLYYIPFEGNVHGLRQTSMDEAQARFTHATALIIHSWSALDIAVKNEWAGPDSSDIRDWLGGVVVDMFSFPPGKQTDVDNVEDVLLQVMEDEFEVLPEDDSARQVY